MIFYIPPSFDLVQLGNSSLGAFTYYSFAGCSLTTFIGVSIRLFDGFCIPLK